MSAGHDSSFRHRTVLLVGPSLSAEVVERIRSEVENLGVTVEVQKRLEEITPAPDYPFTKYMHDLARQVALTRMTAAMSSALREMTDELKYSHPPRLPHNEPWRRNGKKKGRRK